MAIFLRNDGLFLQLLRNAATSIAHTADGGISEEDSHARRPGVPVSIVHGMFAHAQILHF